MPAALKTILCILPGMIFVPAVIFAYSALTGGSVGDLLTSSLIIVLYYIPILGFIAALRVHFRPGHALYPFLIITLMELWALVPDHGPLDLLGNVISLYRETEDTEVLGKSAFVLIGALIPLISLFHRLSLYRAIVAVMASAQCATLVLFHVVILSMPFEGLLAQERHLADAFIRNEASLDVLCRLEGRSCFTGSLEDAKAWAETELPTPVPALKLITDTAPYAPLLHEWMQNPVENPETGNMDELSIISAFKSKPDQITLMKSSTGPSLVYDKLRTSIGLLIAIFHAVWIPLGLAILARHGNYSFQRGRWRRAT